MEARIYTEGGRMLERASLPDVIREDLRNTLALRLLEERGILEVNGHFDYGNAIWAIEKNRSHAIYGIVECFEPEPGTSPVSGGTPSPLAPNFPPPMDKFG